MSDFPRITSLKIDGFKVFDKFEAKLGPLEVIVGANGSGKSSLFELLKINRDGLDKPIPPEIIPGGALQNIFRKASDNQFEWELGIGKFGEKEIIYEVAIKGPLGRPEIIFEQGLEMGYNQEHVWSVVDAFQVDPQHADIVNSNIQQKKRNTRLLLGSFFNFKDTELGFCKTWEHLSRWKFYSSFQIETEKIKTFSLIQEEPWLAEDGNNISSVIHYFLTEHPSLIDELSLAINLVFPNVAGITVKARGGPGSVMAFWREEGVEADLTLADLSDGILRFLCWAVLCLHPKPPTLVCVDEPELGLHPRVLPLLAGLFKKLSERTQVILATHSSYFLSQFALDQIAVMRKVDGRAEWIKPADHKVFRDILEDFGQDEIERLHISDELEVLA